MGNHWLPRPDEQFGPAGHKLLTGATAHAAALGVTPAQLTQLTQLLEDWDGAYAAHQAAQTAAASAKLVKDDARAAAESLMRTLNTAIQAKPEISADLKTELGLPVYDTIPTPAAVPATRPILIVDASQRLQHKITVHDETTPGSRAKPPGVTQFELYCKIGLPAPAGPADCAYLDSSTKATLTIPHQQADGGKPAHYLARWRNSRGERGPWSETVVATIAA